MATNFSEKQHPRLLIVDDDTVITAALSRLAQRRGYEVACVHESSQILGQVATFNPHAIFLDLVMPGLDGVEVIGLLAENKCNAGIVLLSGLDKRSVAMVGNVVKEKNLTLLGSLSKPPDVELIDAILIPLAAEVAADSTPTQGTAVAQRYGMQLSIQPCRNLEETTKALLHWHFLSLIWVLDNNDAIPIEDALAGKVKSCSNRGILLALLQNAAALREQYRIEGRNAGFCFPVSSTLLSEQDFPDFLSKTVASLDLSPAKLMLEIDETAILVKHSQNHDVLSRIKIKGFGIAVVVRTLADELLASINKLAIDELVIDMAHGLDRNEYLADTEAEFQYSSLASVARKAGVTTSAKHVNTKQQLEFIMHCKFERARGNYINSGNSQ